jgi:hypothetical protein
MVVGNSSADGGRGLLIPMVLASARLSRRNSGDVAVAMAGGDSLGAGVCGCATLHLGLRLDGTRNTAPPQHLVVVGFYRYVRNPMYLGFAVGWIGLWVTFGRANPIAIAAVGVAALGVHLFVIFYEEPTLREKFVEATKSISRRPESTLVSAYYERLFRLSFTLIVPRIKARSWRG